MKKLLTPILCLFFFLSYAQEEEVHSIYFQFDKFNLKDEQADAVVKFIQKLDTTNVETIEIFGYCDDRGKDAYNYELSTKRANIVRDKLISKGIKSKIIITLEGKGKILIDDDLETNIPEARSKNRRVDVVINYIPVTIEELRIPGVYSTIPKNPVVGDRIYLDKLLFDRGSSKLTYKAKRELERVGKLLYVKKNIEFEVQGHVCCTPSYHKEAIDRETRKRELSTNRALSVYTYLGFRKISKKRMSYKGYGNTQPLGKGPLLDRRVELVITKI
jgi:outer membrane protein OmpA-like peptidoglycan-associated protein